jgi:hypothetical protein
MDMFPQSSCQERGDQVLPFLHKRLNPMGESNPQNSFRKHGRASYGRLVNQENFWVATFFI